MVRLCFVCLGNICRSPTAEGVMLHLIERAGLSARFQVDSAGTSEYHVGEPPDPRTVETAKKRGVHLPSIARQFQPQDFAQFDYVLAMDAENMRVLSRIAPHDEARKKIHLLRSFDPKSPKGAAVPDPYFGGADGFEQVFDICEAACRGLLEQLKKTL